MKEISVTYYVAEDGKKFTTKQECYAYECKLKYQNLFRALQSIKDLCYEHDMCDDCPFSEGSCCGITGDDTPPMSWHLENWKGFI
jgi:hypothetical protein